jgi:transcription elongation factor Elf1
MNNATNINQIPVCPRCGSDNVAADAAARWNSEQQEWEVSNVFDKGHGCDDCGAEDIEFVWVDHQAQSALVNRRSCHPRALDDIDVREPARVWSLTVESSGRPSQKASMSNPF